MVLETTPVEAAAEVAVHPDPYCEAYAAFLRERPAYGATRALDSLRAREYARLDRSREAYLDHTGTGLYAVGQLRRHHEALAALVLGNPHSENPASLRSNEMLSRARARVLAFFNAPADEYEVAFTYNASGALKLVGEAYPFGRGDRLLLSVDNHNSVNGIRLFARRAHSRVAYLPLTFPELRLEPRRALRELSRLHGRRGLFAFPAQSNYSGVRHDLSLVADARERGWHVLLDAAAYVPTHRLDLSAVKPDFVPVSFYKMFGYPTGLGCLIARTETLSSLGRPWFAGGTITIVSTLDERFHRLVAGAQSFEDGTPDFLALPAVEIGLDHLESVGMETIDLRLRELTGWLLDSMLELRHTNGEPLVRVFGPRDTRERGPVVAFRIVDPGGSSHNLWAVQERACEQRISLRTGCFCNPGANEAAHRLSRRDVAPFYAGPGPGVMLDEYYDGIEAATGGIAPGAIRASLGITSDFSDVWRLVRFIEGFRDVPALAAP